MQLRLGAAGTRRRSGVMCGRIELSGILLVCAALGTACHKDGPPASSVTMACTVAPQPPRVGDAVVTVRLVDRADKPVTGARIKLEADMSHPGMEPLFAQASETAPGRYVAHMQFTMPGDWVILVEGALANGQRIDRQVDVKGVLPG